MCPEWHHGGSEGNVNASSFFYTIESWYKTTLQFNVCVIVATIAIFHLERYTILT